MLKQQLIQTLNERLEETMKATFYKVFRLLGINISLLYWTLHRIYIIVLYLGYLDVVYLNR